MKKIYTRIYRANNKEKCGNINKACGPIIWYNAFAL